MIQRRVSSTPLPEKPKKSTSGFSYHDPLLITSCDRILLLLLLLKGGRNLMWIYSQAQLSLAQGSLYPIFWDAVRSRIFVPIHTYCATILPVVPEWVQSYAPSTQKLCRSSSLFSLSDLDCFFRISTYSRNSQGTTWRMPHSYPVSLVGTLHVVTIDFYKTCRFLQDGSKWKNYKTQDFQSQEFTSVHRQPRSQPQALHTSSSVLCKRHPTQTLGRGLHHLRILERNELPGKPCPRLGNS